MITDYSIEGGKKQGLFMENFYISKTGTVYDYKSGKELKQYNVGRERNYRQVFINGKTHYVHWLVAKQYIPNPNNYPQINHKDGNPSNNYYKNLEWVTASQNQKHAYSNLRQTRECPFCNISFFPKASFLFCAKCGRDILRELNALLIKNQRAQEVTDLFIEEKGKKALMLSLRREGKTYKEIAEVMDCSIQYIHQTIQKLKERKEKQ